MVGQIAPAASEMIEDCIARGVETAESVSWGGDTLGSPPAVASPGGRGLRQAKGPSDGRIRPWASLPCLKFDRCWRLLDRSPRMATRGRVN